MGLRPPRIVQSCHSLMPSYTHIKVYNAFDLDATWFCWVNKEERVFILKNALHEFPPSMAINK
ncbi:Uncharacterized protein APZ42_022494 [Daphnia magna]|uniref:Uncharacterized protein n=1 Tax=Daphnia magna TaxID=35525 RepID=A0A164VIA2_9CRUS|nr:Uncharacterized protein APZ42_022494 [Daphnia magna]